MYSPNQNNAGPIPKPRTLLNCGRQAQNGGKTEINGNDHDQSTLEVDTSTRAQTETISPSQRISVYPSLIISPGFVYFVIHKNELGIPPPKPPRESPTGVPARPPPPVGWNIKLPSPEPSTLTTTTRPNCSPPSRVAPALPTNDFKADKPVPLPPVPPRPLHLNHIVPMDSFEDFWSSPERKPLEVSPKLIENAAYMTLQKYRELAVSSSNESSFYSLPPVTDSNINSSETDVGSLSIALVHTEAANSELMAEIPPRNLLDLKPMPPPTSCRKSFNDYTPPPKRDDYALVSECGTLIDAIEHECTFQEDVTICEMENDDQEAEGVAVSFFGFVQIHVGKKEKKRAHARLRNMHLSFHEDDETEEYLCGPYQLTGCRLISRTGDTISIRLNELESQKHLIFNLEDGRDNWSLVLSECWLTQFSALRSSVDSLTTCGTFYLRQGTASEWQSASGGILGRSLHYFILSSPDTIYELDIRKVLSIREKIEKEQWCQLVKKKNHRGPFILILEGCSLFIECDDEWSTNLWQDVINEILLRPASSLEEYRLTGDNIPIIVDKCIRFVAVYGMESEGIYRRNGKISEAKDILAKLNKDAPGVHLKPITDETVYAVADALRQFFRRLSTPLISHDIQSTLFNIVNEEADTSAKIADLGQCLTNLHYIHYNTLRKLMSHLADVTNHADKNRASVENLAKIFGASLFHTEAEEGLCFGENSSQISVIAFLINNYNTIFETTSREELSRVLIEEAQKSKTPQHKATRTDCLLIPIHIWERDNCAFNVKFTLAAEEACREAVAKRGFDAPSDGKYGLFEMVRGGALSRRLFDGERLSDIVINRWITWKCHDGYLLFDKDTSIPITPDNMSSFSGKVKMADQGSKSFKSMELKINEGERVVAFKNEKKYKEWQLDKTVWFTGSEPSRKAPFAFCLTFFVENSSFADKHPGFCISFRSPGERTNFLNQIHYIQQGSRPVSLVHI